MSYVFDKIRVNMSKHEHEIKKIKLTKLKVDCQNVITLSVCIFFHVELGCIRRVHTRDGSLKTAVYQACPEVL
jgi:hypothetical protein